MSKASPLVSLGLPVFNGENYVEEALDSALRQTYQNVELIIIDNASTDRTVDICKRYAADDDRVSIHCNEKNRGAAYSFNKAFAHAHGDYFKWLAHDDRFDYRFIERCVEIMESDPEIAWCFSDVVIIDDQGVERLHRAEPPKLSDSDRVVDRFGAVLKNDHYCFDVFGLVRRSCLENTGLIRSFAGSDRILRAELAFQGKYHQVRENLFYLRDHAERSVRAMPSHHQRSKWFDTNNTSRTSFPYWRILGEYIKAIHRCDLTWRQKLACQAQILHWLRFQKHWAKMIADLIIAIWPASWKWLYRLGQNGTDMHVHMGNKKVSQ